MGLTVPVFFLSQESLSYAACPMSENHTSSFYFCSCFKWKTKFSPHDSILFRTEVPLLHGLQQVSSLGSLHTKQRSFLRVLVSEKEDQRSINSSQYKFSSYSCNYSATQMSSLQSVLVQDYIPRRFVPWFIDSLVPSIHPSINY